MKTTILRITFVLFSITCLLLLGSHEAHANFAWFWRGGVPWMRISDGETQPSTKAIQESDGAILAEFTVDWDELNTILNFSTPGVGQVIIPNAGEGAKVDALGGLSVLGEYPDEALNIGENDTSFWKLRIGEARDTPGGLEFDVDVVPEPATVISFLFGGAGLAAKRFLKRRKA